MPHRAPIRHDDRVSDPAVLGPDLYGELDRRLADTDAVLARRYPGDAGDRQPVHTVYLPADRYTADAVPRWTAACRRLLAEHGLGLLDLLQTMDFELTDALRIYQRMTAKIEREPIEDLRIDVEDGYGHRPDEEEDADVAAAAAALSEAVRAGTGTPFYGLRCKSLEAPTRARAVRSLDLFVTGLVAAGPLPDGLVLTLPKVSSTRQVEAMVLICERLEAAHRLPAGRLRFELQVETPQAVLGADGTATVARMIHAAGGRCAGLHYGTYDYSAALGIAAAYQSLEHPAADHAKAVMQVAAAGTGVRLSDGSSNVLPYGDRDAVLAGWRLHLRLVRRSLQRGFYQGWDLHPAQLPSRYVATYAFFRRALPAAADRLRDYADRTSGAVLDEPATAAALAGVLLRGLDCSALDEDEVHELAGLDRAALAALRSSRA